MTIDLIRGSRSWLFLAQKHRRFRKAEQLFSAAFLFKRQALLTPSLARSAGEGQGGDGIEQIFPPILAFPRKLGKETTA